MPTFLCEDASLYYEIHGDGFPVLLFTPGGLSSQISYWSDAIAMLSPHFKVIVMDQRNATDRSQAPIRAKDGWHTYTNDHINLLDHLGIQRCHVMGMCIGPSFALALMKVIPQRIAACVFVQAIGLAPENQVEGIPSPNNRQAFYDYNYQTWAPKRAPDVAPAVLREFFDRLYAEDFVFSVSESDVAKMPHPMLVLSGNDLHHPSFISERLATVAPNAELIGADWKNKVNDVWPRVISFLKQHSGNSCWQRKATMFGVGGSLVLLAAVLLWRPDRAKL